MRYPNSLPGLLKRVASMMAAAVAGLMLLSLAGPAAAQFFPFFGGNDRPPPRQQPRGGGYGYGGGFFGGDDGPYFAPFRPRQQPRRPAPVVREDYSHAPQSDNRDESAAERNVLVLGDSMADWLGYGLEDAYSEQPDMGVIRKHKTVSGLIRYQPKGDPADWAAAAKNILAHENPDAIVIMLGLHDRIPIRESAADKADEKKPDKARAPRADDKADAELGDEPAEAADTPAIGPERGAPRPASNGVAEFRDERWAALYAKKIDEMIAVLKSKGAPVLWVGLPAIRGAKATSDMLFLNALYRDAAGRAGITYVDVWDGFVDETGRFMQQGPDFDGQIRRLRSYDGVYFTKAGARKLAHYTEREITRLLASRSAPVTLPNEPATPDTETKPEGPAPRPLVGPILPLVASAVNSEQLLGAPGARPLAVDALAARTLVQGEPLTPPPGRADDPAWPRREVGSEQAPRGGDMPVASTTPVASATPTAAAAPVAAAPAAPRPAKTRKPRPNNRVARPQQSPPSDFRFGAGQSPQGQRLRPAPRPPADLGFSAGLPSFFR